MKTVLSSQTVRFLYGRSFVIGIPTVGTPQCSVILLLVPNGVNTGISNANLRLVDHLSLVHQEQLER